jgi:hypothetical protein
MISYLDSPEYRPRTPVETPYFAMLAVLPTVLRSSGTILKEDVKF